MNSSKLSKSVMILGQKDGMAAVETALMLPFLLIILFGIVEFSLCMYDRAVITNASREGARAGIVYRYDQGTGLTHPPDGEITNVVTQYCRNHLVSFGEGADPEVIVLREGNQAGDDLTVRVRYRYDFLVLPQFVANLGGGMDLVAQTVMRLE